MVAEAPGTQTEWFARSQALVNGRMNSRQMPLRRIGERQ